MLGYGLLVVVLVWGFVDKAWGFLICLKG